MADCRATVSGALELAIRNHIPYEFLLDDHLSPASLRGYGVVVLPDVVTLTEEQCEALREYVSGGGGIFATYETSLYDAMGERLPDFALADLLGTHYAGEAGEMFLGYSAGYAKFTGRHPLSPGQARNDLFPMGGKYLAVESSDTVAMLLKRCRYYCDYPQPVTANPAVIAREYGRGRVVYVPGEFFSFYHQKGLLQHAAFFRQAVTWLAGGSLPVETDLPDTVEVTLTRASDGRRVLHMINCSFDKTRPISETLPVCGRCLSFASDRPCERAVDITTGRKVLFDNREGRIEIALPELTGYNVIVLE